MEIAKQGAVLCQKGGGGCSFAVGTRGAASELFLVFTTLINTVNY